MATLFSAWTAPASAQGVADGKTAVAWTKKLTKNDQGYSYSLTQYGENGDDIEASAENDLPKYDKNGHLYEYRAVEVTDGLANKPGGFTANDLTNTSAGFAAGKVYWVQQGIPGSSLITNTYASEKGKLTVKKLYDGLDAGDKVPDTTFTLYRYYVTKDGTKSDAQPVATHTLSAGDVVLSAGGDGATTGEGSYTFDNVDIYTPSGEYWVYYIVEDSVDGYGTLVAKGDKTFGDASVSPGAASWVTALPRPISRDQAFLIQAHLHNLLPLPWQTTPRLMSRSRTRIILQMQLFRCRARKPGKTKATLSAFDQRTSPLR